MQPLFEFIGHYWWLAFPLMGAMGAIGGAWERRARHRHKRRLEILQAKSELRLAQAEARGKIAPRPRAAALASPATAPAAAAEGSHAEQIERLFSAHDAVTKRWLEYELDVAKLIAFPAMSDGRQPLTAAFLRAKKVADGLRPASAKARITREQLTDYRGAVTDFEVAFDVAERDARRIKDSSFTEAERKRLDTAKQLLTVAIDQAATPAERQLAYRRVREELDGLLSLSDGAIEVLESKVSLELTSGTRIPDAAPSEAPDSRRSASTAASPAPASDSARPTTATPRPTTASPPPAAAPASRPRPDHWPVPARSSGGGTTGGQPKP